MAQDREAGREVLPDPRPTRMRGSSPTTRRIPTRRSRRSSRSGRRTAHRTSSIVLLDDIGFAPRARSADPRYADRRAIGGERPQVQPLPHDRALLTDTPSAAYRAEPSLRWDGRITEIATSAPGYNSIRPNTTAPLAETLKLNGYSTAQFGKCHEVPVWETSPMGPFNAWPTGSGGSSTSTGSSAARPTSGRRRSTQDTVPIEPDRTAEEGYHFTEDMTDQAIDWMRQQKALMPDKPFFVYFAPGATHAPHHVPTEWSDKYKGKFDQGWDRLREAVVRAAEGARRDPGDAELTARPEEIPAWDETPEEMQPVFARQMEVYAGFLEHTDHHVGRFVDALADLEILDNTLIYYIIGDNGASAEGTPERLLQRARRT